MKKIIPLASFLLLNGCMSPTPTPTVKSLDVKMSCEATAHIISFKRDMSAMTVDGEVLPLLSSTIKDSKRTYGIYGVSNSRKSTNKLDIGRKYDREPLFWCEPEDLGDTIPIVATDYTTPSALRDEKEHKEKEVLDAKKAAKDDAEYHKASLAAKKQCNVYSSDLAARTGLKHLRLMSALPMSTVYGDHLVNCVIMATGGVYGESVSLRITGKGDNYQYEEIN